jgi:GNAT superfamily N-acetyltransferase
MEHIRRQALCNDAMTRILKIGTMDGIEMTRFSGWEGEKNLDGYDYIIRAEYKIDDISVMIIKLQTNTECTRFDDLEVTDLDTIEGHRNKGYARRLLKQAELVAKEFGINSIYGDMMDNNAKEFYEKCGYVVSGSYFEKLLNK